LASASFSQAANSPLQFCGPVARLTTVGLIPALKAGMTFVEWRWRENANSRDDGRGVVMAKERRVPVHGRGVAMSPSTARPRRRAYG
jgi:hypothetical protein